MVERLWASFGFNSHFWFGWCFCKEGGGISSRHELHKQVLFKALRTRLVFTPVSCFSLAAHGHCLGEGELPAVNPGFYLMGFGALESVCIRRGRFDSLEIQVCFVGRVWICSVFALGLVCYSSESFQCFSVPFNSTKLWWFNWGQNVTLLPLGFPC